MDACAPKRARARAHTMIGVTLSRRSALGSIRQAGAVPAGFFGPTPGQSSAERRTHTPAPVGCASAGLTVARFTVPSPAEQHPALPRPNRCSVGSVLTCESDKSGSARSLPKQTTDKVYQSFALFSSARPRRREEPRTAAENRSQVGKEGRGPAGKRRSGQRADGIRKAWLRRFHSRLKIQSAFLG